MRQMLVANVFALSWITCISLCMGETQTELISVPAAPQAGDRFFVCPKEQSAQPKVKAKWRVFVDDKEAPNNSVVVRGDWLQVSNAVVGTYICVLEATDSTTQKTSAIRVEVSPAEAVRFASVTTRQPAAVEEVVDDQQARDEAPVQDPEPANLKQRIPEVIGELDLWTRDVNFLTNARKMSDAIRRATKLKASTQDDVVDNILDTTDPVIEGMKGRTAPEAWDEFLEDVTNEGEGSNFDLRDNTKVADARGFWRVVADGIEASLKVRDDSLRKQAVAYLVSKGFRASDFSSGTTSRRSRGCLLRLFLHR